MRIVIFLLLLSATCFGQTSQKTIAVEGQARMKVKPDVVYITFSLEKSDTSQAKAMAKANQQLDELSKIFKSQGWLDEQIKISEYRIDREYGSDRKKKEYTVSNTLVATLYLNNKQINDVLKSIEAKRINGVGISFEYGLSDSLEKAVRTLLVHKAIEDAKANATNISKSLNIQLKGIHQVLKRGLQPIIYEELMEARVGGPTAVETTKGFIFDSPFGNYNVEEKELTEDLVIIYEIGS
jgi:uncharacterized protein YggE